MGVVMSRDPFKICRKFTYSIINTPLWERKSARALRTICRVEFLHKLSTINDVTKYRDISVSRYFLDGILLSHVSIPIVFFSNLCICFLWSTSAYYTVDFVIGAFSPSYYRFF